MSCKEFRPVPTNQVRPIPPPPPPPKRITIEYVEKPLAGTSGLNESESNPVDILTMHASPVNHVTFEALDGRAILDAARELDRQYIADAVVAHEIAELAAKHEQDEIAGYRPKAFDSLTSHERAAYIAHAKIGLRMNRPAWRALQMARMQAAALLAIEEFASQWVPQDRRDALALYLASRISTAGRYVMDEHTDKPTPREFATAMQLVQRRGDR